MNGNEEYIIIMPIKVISWHDNRSEGRDVMAEEKNICYFYGRECEAFVAELKVQEEGGRIFFVSFALNDVFPAVEWDRIDHLIVTGTAEEIKVIFELAKKHHCSIGIVPLPGQEKMAKILDLPDDPVEAFGLAKQPSEKKIDLFYCNDLLVLSDVRIGNTTALKEYEFQFSEYSLPKRLRLLWQAYRKKRLLKHYQFSLKTEKEEQITLSSIGMIGIGYNNGSWVATRMASRLSAIDGQHLLLILSPLSLFQYFVSSPLTLLLQRWRGDRLPSSCGYIKSNRVELDCPEPVKVVIDDEEARQTPVVLQTESEALALSVGKTFWEKQAASKTERNSIRIDNVPRDEETIRYLGKGLPLFRHASKEQYAALFGSLREEGNISSTFVILLVIATMIATLGLFINSSSVIIGAMILAPLMQPIVSLSMGVLRQDESLTANAIKTIGIGIVLTITVAMLIAWLTPIREMTNEMTARLSPTILDMLIAIASGIAAAYVKNDDKISASLAGVAIAVALVPPLAVSGIGLGWGDGHIFFNALLLFLTNLIGIVFAGALTFLILGFAPIHVAKKGIMIWTVIAFLIAVPLYHSFETMREAASVRSTLLHIKFEIDGKRVYLNRVEYRPRGEEAEIRCEVIVDHKLKREDRTYLKHLVEKVVGRPTKVIATFRYEL